MKRNYLKNSWLWLVLMVVGTAFAACSEEEEDYGPDVPQATITIDALYRISDLVLTNFQGTITNAHSGQSWPLPAPVQDGNKFTVTLANQPSGHYDVKASGDLSFTIIDTGEQKTTHFEVTADHYELSVDYPDIHMAISYSLFFDPPTK